MRCRKHRRNGAMMAPIGLAALLVIAFLPVWLGLVLLPAAPSAAAVTTEVALVINGQQVQPDVPPRIVSGRTLVPIRVISENLGALVGWEATTRTVTVALADRLVQLVVGEQVANVDGHPVQLDVPSQITNGRTLVPLRFVSESLGAYVAWDEQTRTVAISQDQQVLEPPADVPMATGLSYRITESGPAIAIETSGPAQPAAFIERQPARIVVDLPGVVTAGNLPPTVTVNDGSVRRLRIGQFDRDVVRAVIDLDRPMDFTLLSDGQTTLIYPHQQIVDVSMSVTGDEALIDVRGEISLGHHVVVTDTGIDLLIPYATFPGGSARLDSETPWITAVTMEQTELAGAPAVKITANLRQYQGHQVSIDDQGQRLSLAIAIGGDGPSTGSNALRGRTIAVDPGHGGKDPGSTGISGFYEKDLTEHLGLMLKQKLENAGAEVVLTRNGDETVDLYERAALANAAGADAFISVHLNAYHHPDLQGTETYHHPTSEHGKRLADFVHKEMVKVLARTDRGVRGADFVVLRETKMPAVLVEPGFVTNPEEAALLLDPAFQQRIVEAIYEGLLRFFDANL